MLLEFKIRGLSHSGTNVPTQAELALHVIQRENRVDYAGPFCGRPAGLHVENELRILATSPPSIITPKKGTRDCLNQFISNLLGHGVDPLFETQFSILVGWLQRWRKALEAPELHLPGQAPILCGPPDCGKSLLQHLITKMGGGREADPCLWLSKDSSFNSELWGAEHLVLGDESLGYDYRQRAHLRDQIKKLVANPIYPFHRKKVEAMSARPIWRLSISANDDPDSATVLPPLDAGLKDKVIILRCYSPPTPFPTRTDSEYTEFYESLVNDIPGFLYQVENYRLDDSFKKGRFGVREFHHPAIVDIIDDLSPITPFGESVQRWIDRSAEHKISGTAIDLYDKYRDSFSSASQARQYARNGAHFGKMLSQLSRTEGWKNRVVRQDERKGENRKRVTIWTIYRSNSPEADREDREFIKETNREKQ